MRVRIEVHESVHLDHKSVFECVHTFFIIQSLEEKKETRALKCLNAHKNTYTLADDFGEKKVERVNNYNVKLNYFVEIT